jgi:predicted nucleotidyltransferase
MRNLEEIKVVLNNHKADLRNKYCVKTLGVFGSVAREDTPAPADIDILVEFEKPIGLDFVALAEELESLLEMKVDLVSRNSIKPKMFNFIKEDLIYV